MKNKELKNATRKELIELLVEVYEENNLLRSENEELKKEVKKQTMIICEKDSLAEIEIKISGVFDVVDAAKKKYLENEEALQLTKDK